MSLRIEINEKDQQQGNRDAPLVLLEYGDYECPYCGAAYPIVKKLQRHFRDKLLFVFRNFPLTEIHPYALKAAFAAEAAGLQQRFWPLHDLIFENQPNINMEYLLNFIRAIGADEAQLISDMNEPRIINKVEKDIEGGIKYGVNGTPAFFINGKRHDGDYEYETIKSALDNLL